MLEHHRRIHKAPDIDGASLKDSSSGHEDDRGCPTPSFSDDDRGMMEAPTAVNEEEQHHQITVHKLRTKLDALKEQRHKIDQEIDAITISLRVMED